jgi:CBS domain-containing membrane protein
MLYVSDLMSKKLVTLLESDTLLEARQLMDLARIRHIPIVDAQHRFIGLLTNRDVLTYAVSKLADIDQKTRDEIDSGIPLAEIMRTDVTTVAPTHNLRDAAETLLHHKYGSLPVVEGEKLVGILTEADFLKLAIRLLDAVEDAESR